jgi:NAD(P)H-dependent FMN reductase
LLISGSLRAGSINAAVLRTTRQALPPDVEGVIYEGLGQLPHFNPDDDADAVPAEVAALRAAIHAAAAIVVSTPEYAGALPGSFKNLLDWTIGDDNPASIYDKPVAWINASPRGAEGAHEELRRVLSYAHARVVDDACLHVPITQAIIGSDGLVADAAARDGIARAAAILSDRVGCGPDALSGNGGDASRRDATEEAGQPSRRHRPGE